MKEFELILFIHQIFILMLILDKCRIIMTPIVWELFINNMYQLVTANIVDAKICEFFVQIILKTS